MDGKISVISDKNKRKLEKLKKSSLIELKETLQRENDLLKNVKLINKLPDKGKSILEFRDQIELEIKYRENLSAIENTVSGLKLDQEQSKHDLRLCEIEKVPAKDRYKPFSTLNKVQEVKPDSRIFKIIEDCKPIVNPSKLISLPESIDIMKKQEERVKEIQTKERYNRMCFKIKQDEEIYSSAESENSDD